MSIALSSQQLDRISQYIRTEVGRRALPGAAFALVQGDRTLAAFGVGSTRANGGGSVTPDTLFRVGSVTKSITAMAILQLRDRGLLELDAPVRRYLPWFAVADQTASGQITVRHLLNQTSGLGYAAWKVALVNPALKKSRRKAVRALQFWPVGRAPGARFEYANMNYEVLGEIITAVSGQDYAVYIREHILGPLGMAETTFDHRIALKRDWARPHLKEFGRLKEMPVEPETWLAASGLALFSSAGDMARYLSAKLREGQPEPTNAVETNVKGIQYAHGWMVTRYNGERLVFHAGLAAGSNAMVCLLPERNLGFVLLINCLGANAEQIATGVVRLLQGADTKAPSLLPDFTGALNVASGVLGALGAGLLAGLAWYAGRPIGTAGALVWTVLTLVLLWLPRTLKKSPSFPLPVPIGPRLWPAELSAAWRVLLAGPVLWSLYAWIW